MGAQCDVPTTTWHLAKLAVGTVESSEVKWNEMRERNKNQKRAAITFHYYWMLHKADKVGREGIEQWIERSRNWVEELPIVSVTFRQIESENLWTK